MKTMLAAALIALAAQVSAAPYFRPLDLSAPRFSAGVLLDPAGGAAPAAFTSAAIVTHSPEDGCLFPSIACVDWSPLTIGGSFGGSRGTLGVGPSANMAPIMRAGLLLAVEKLTPDDQFLDLKDRLGVGSQSPSDVTVALGPSLAWNVIEGGTVLPINRWKGAVRVTIGAAWKLGRRP